MLHPIFILLACGSAAAFGNQVIIPAPPQVSADAYVLMDASTRKVIVEHNSGVKLPPASLTKMMTSYIVSEEIYDGRLKETDLVTISEDAWSRGGTVSGSSTMFLSPRTEVAVIDLLRGVIIQSGNDASIALAQHIAGSELAFADVMNQHAKLLGMKDSQFRNATGWPEEGHLTTAQDLAVLAVALIKDHPEHYAIYSEKNFEYNGISQSNRNKLLFTNKTVDGVKTGHTEEAGFGLVASAKIDGMRLISVVLGTKSEKQRAADSEQLLAFGFRYYQTQNLYKGGEVLTEHRIWRGASETLTLGVEHDLVATIPRGSEKNLQAETQIEGVIEAPVTKGQVLGKLVVKLDGETLAEKDLVALTAVEEAGFFSRMWDSLILLISDPS